MDGSPSYFFEKLKEFGFPSDVIDKLDSFDELTKNDKEIMFEEIEIILKNRLLKFSDTFWHAKWSKEDD